MNFSMNESSNELEFQNQSRLLRSEEYATILRDNALNIPIDAQAAQIIKELF